MEYTEYRRPEKFLEAIPPEFRENETLYGLMIGITLKLADNPFHYGSQPLLATISQDNKIQLAALMTPPYKLQIALLSDSVASIPLLVSELHSRNWPVPAVLAEEKAAKIFASHWNNIAGTVSRVGMRQRMYKLQMVQYPPDPGGFFRQATVSDLELLIKWRNAFHDEVFTDDTEPRVTVSLMRSMTEEGKFFVWQHDIPVSMAGLTRPTLHGMSINDVYTPPQFREKGYASALVARLSQYVLDNGKAFCSLYTDLSNPVSNSIYQNIGYHPVADVIDIVFREARES